MKKVGYFLKLYYRIYWKLQRDKSAAVRATLFLALVFFKNTM